MRPTLVVAVMTALLMVGCGSSSTGSGSASSPTPTKAKATLIAKADPCTLVTADDASAAVGTAVMNQSTAGQGSSTVGICLYVSSDSQASVIVVAEVYPDNTAAGSVSPEQMASTFGSAFGISNSKSVSGIGDKAIEFDGTSAGTTGKVIIVFKSNVVILVIARPSDSSKIEQLAKTAVGKL